MIEIRVEVFNEQGQWMDVLFGEVPVLPYIGGKMNLPGRGNVVVKDVVHCFDSETKPDMIFNYVEIVVEQVQ